MGVENTVGLYIDGLNATWPDGVTEYVREGDDHIRAIKAAVKNTFPNLDDAVTATVDDLNFLAGVAVTYTDLADMISKNAIPSGTKMLFAQATAPNGWTKDTDVNDKTIRIVSGATGGSTGGSWTLSLTGNTGYTNVSHRHNTGLALATSAGALYRYYTTNGGARLRTALPNFVGTVCDDATNQKTVDAEIETSTETSVSSALNHRHSISLSTSSFRGAYLDTIKCTKD